MAKAKTRAPAAANRGTPRASARLAGASKAKEAADEERSAASSNEEQPKAIVWNRKRRQLSEPAAKSAPAKAEAATVPATTSKPKAAATRTTRVSAPKRIKMEEADKASSGAESKDEKKKESSSESGAEESSKSSESESGEEATKKAGVARRARAQAPKTAPAKPTSAKGARAKPPAASKAEPAAKRQRAAPAKRDEVSSASESEASQSSSSSSSSSESEKEQSDAVAKPQEEAPKKRGPGRPPKSAAAGAGSKAAAGGKAAAKPAPKRPAKRGQAEEKEEDEEEKEEAAGEDGSASGGEEGYEDGAVDGERARALVEYARGLAEAEGLGAPLNKALLAVAEIPDGPAKWRGVLEGGLADFALPLLCSPEASAVRVQLPVGSLIHLLGECARADLEGVAGRVLGRPGALAAVSRLLGHRDTVRRGVVVNAIDLLAQLSLHPAARARLAEETRAEEGEEREGSGPVAGSLRALRALGCSGHMPPAAARLLDVLSDDEAWHGELLRAGAPRELLRFLAGPPEGTCPEAARSALSCLRNLAADHLEAVAAAAKAERGAAAVARHLAAGAEGAGVAGALLVAELARDEALHSDLRTRGAVASLVALLQRPAGEARAAALAAIAAFAFESERGAAEVRVQGGVRPVLQLLRSENTAAVAALAVENLSVEEGCREEIVGAGGVPSLVALLRSGPRGEAVEHSLGALLNVTAYTASGQEAAEAGVRAVARAEELRVELRDEGAVPALCPLLEAPWPAPLRAAAAGALGDLALSPHVQAEVSAAAAAPLAALLADPAAPPEARAAAAAALGNTAEGSEAGRARALEASPAPLAALVELLACPAATRSAASALGSLWSADAAPLFEAAGAQAALAAACAAPDAAAARAARAALARIEGRAVEPEPEAAAEQQPAAAASAPATAPAAGSAKASGPSAASAGAGARRKQLSIRVWKEARGVVLACPDTMEELLEEAAGRLGRVRGRALEGAQVLVSERGDVVEDVATLLACRDSVYYLAPAAP
eukprot:tig00021035_g17259.t1